MGRKVGLTVDDVSAAAMTLADEEGWAAVTLSAVAERLGIRVPSLYNHVAGLDGLRRLVAFGAAEQLTGLFVEASESDADPLAAVWAMATAYRRFAVDHPGLYRSLLPAPDPAEDPELAEALMRPVAVAGEALGRLGVAPAEVVDRVRVLRSYLHGFADLEVDGGFGLPADIDRSFEVGLDQILAGLSP